MPLPPPTTVNLEPNLSRDTKQWLHEVYVFSELIRQRIHLTKDTTQNVGGADGTVTYVSWDADAAAKSSGFIHEDVTNPTRILVKASGLYRVTWVIGVAQGGAARTTFMSHLRVNGTTLIIRGRHRNYSRGSAYGDSSVGMDTEVSLTAGDYIECGVTVDDTDASYTSNTINEECEVIVRRLP